MAIRHLPPEITFAFNPYANGVAQIVQRARTDGHEVLLNLPMEPNGYPTIDPGPQTLLTRLSAKENVERRLKVNFPDRYVDGNPEAKVYQFHNPDDLIVVVAGGAGKHSAWLPTFGQDTKSVTLPLRLADQRLARRVEEFRQG